jgi:sulfite exporter TauE/SafE
MFVLALLASGFTSAFNCVALQMALLGSTIAVSERRDRSFIFWATAAFLLAKLSAYTLLGFLLGWLGETVSLSPEVGTWVELVAGTYVIVAALAVLNVHPVLRYAIIQPPRFLTRYVRKASKSHEFFAPVLLGVMTVLIPCGTTVGVEALALESRSPIVGAWILGIFTLGTMPVFIGFGSLVATLGARIRRNFDGISAIIILLLGLYALYGTLGELLGGSL